MAHPRGFEPLTARFVAEYTPLAGERLQPARPSHHTLCLWVCIILDFSEKSNAFLTNFCIFTTFADLIGKKLIFYKKWDFAKPLQNPTACCLSHELETITYVCSEVIAS